MLKKYIGDKAFYRSVFAIAIPMTIQNFITNFVSLLDNIMVGQLGTAQMSGVSVVNQFVFIFSLCLVGATSGTGIFTAQFYGSNDVNGIRYTFRFKTIVCLLLGVIGILVLSLAGAPLINTFLRGEGSAEDIQQTLQYGLEYIPIILWGFLPQSLYFAYSTTLRECGQTTVPMVSGSVAVCVNLFFNYVFIFGHFGLPAMGIRGAALATVMARYVELFIVVWWTHKNHRKHPFIEGAYRSIHIPKPLVKKIAIKGSPLLANEFLWAFGMTFLNQCYSTRGFNVVSATNITSTISNLSSVMIFALGATISIILGQMMGAGRPAEEIKIANQRLTALSVFLGFVFGGLLALIAFPFPKFYNTSAEIHLLSAQLILVMAVTKPADTYMYSAYFTLRSGGKTWIAFIYDGGYIWAITAPIVYLLSRFTDIGIVPLYTIGLCANFIKCIGAYFVIRRGNWIQNLTK